MIAPQVEQLGASPISYMLRIALEAWKRPRSCNVGPLLDGAEAVIDDWASGGMLPPGADVLPIPLSLSLRRYISSANLESCLCVAESSSGSSSGRIVGDSGRGAACGARPANNVNCSPDRKRRFSQRKM